MHQIHRLPPMPFTGEALFDIRRLNFHYPNGHCALRNIDLRIAPGDRIALVGQNGSGKSTLVRHLNGLLAVQQGRLTYKGLPLGGEHLRRARLEIGLLFQDPDDQLFCNSLYEDVAFGPLNQGLQTPEVDLLVKESLAQVGLGHLLYKPSHHLSYGQKKRAALATLLAMKPEVLILDEPTANLDSAQENILIELLRDFAGTLICITHDLLFAYELCRRAVVLDQGRIHHDFSMPELVSHRPSLREHGLDFSFRLHDPLATAAPLPAAEIAELAPPRAVAPPPSGAGHAPPLVELRAYHFAYPDGTCALNGIDFSLRPGESVAVVGENGAGKTTLLSCLLGVRHGEGAHLFAGRPVGKKQRRELWRQVGMVFQDPSDQLFCASCAEEVAFGPRQMGLPTDEIARRVAEALARVRLAGYEERVPLHLSGGERKRLAIATVLSLNPEILILDEPTAGLDPQGEELLLEILGELSQTRVLVSHDPYLVGKLTQRTLVMHQGRILEDYSTAEFLADQNHKNLNALALSYKSVCCNEIRELQHRHEHSHPHRHLHEHAHRHGDLVHCHLHEHEHMHPHDYIHAHHTHSEQHDHPPQPRYHEHGHAEHEQEPHEHEHRPEAPLEPKKTAPDADR
ncbi:energy-coupling factor transport system ATP-binding protein [Geoalkalibacter ferrihydriticus]|uniref:Energy-coupling factor transport system ATP-binding protein n=1 Tax=Geoalkalibacter ferrihydriticus TaxID=392333 RepID=A0A1G9I7M6_9BACT|nr:ABC transporter ATP-binding protein [Geoalkalibacter ferrihydriticus]SDL21228.1 energy-coupling factor transport system ATP-binding protein [Geoalkalibacter ferrihydriticus]